MTITAVSRCSQCEAVVNVHWPSCLVCHGALPPLVKSGDSPGAVESNSPASTAPIPPLQPGWLVTYRNRQGKLSGGSGDRAHGTVQECRWDSTGWTLYLTDGQQVSLSLIQAVGKADNMGHILAAWTVREHGIDGNRKSSDAR